VRDSFTALDYADQRYYASSYGRFNTADRLASSAMAGDPGSWNRYSYAGGDPINRSDPKGLCSQDIDYNWWDDDQVPEGDFSGVMYPGNCTDSPVWVSWANSMAPGSVSLNGSPFYPAGDGDGGPTFSTTVTSTQPQPICDIELFGRSAGFRGDPGSHTYIDFLDTAGGATTSTIVEGGPSSAGNLYGFVEPPDDPLGKGSKHATNPTKNKELGSELAVPCTDLGVLETNISLYNFNPQPYARIPNGSSTYNSNSFTYTLLGNLGLSLTDFGVSSLPTSFSILHPLQSFYPGWGFTVPGL
jgi:RHS repeat-associated protein